MGGEEEGVARAGGAGGCGEDGGVVEGVGEGGGE